MKALVAGFSVGREVWGKLKSRVLGQESTSKGLTLEFTEAPEPLIVSSQWLKIRAVMAGISDLDESLILHSDPAPYGPSLTFPFIPGNENLGIVTEAGSAVQGIDAGDRVVVNPLLSCVSREIDPICPMCRKGAPASCANFSEGVIGPGMIIGGCSGASGGWADSFIAHQSQVRLIPHEMESDQAVMIPEFTRALRAVCNHPPAKDETVLINGAGSLGLLAVMALKGMGYDNRIILVAHSPEEAEMAENIGDTEIVISSGPGLAYEKIGALLDAKPLYPEVGKVSMQGGADLVYETTGLSLGMEDAVAFTTEGGRMVMMAIRESWGFSAPTLWRKDIRIHSSSFSGLEYVDGESLETFDLAMKMANEKNLPINKLITHRFNLDQFKEAFELIGDKKSHGSLKVIFQHVV